MCAMALWRFAICAIRHVAIRTSKRVTRTMAGAASSLCWLFAHSVRSYGRCWCGWYGYRCQTSFLYFTRLGPASSPKRRFLSASYSL